MKNHWRVSIKKWKKLFSKEKMEQCLFYVYRCVQPLGQDSV